MCISTCRIKLVCISKTNFILWKLYLISAKVEICFFFHPVWIELGSLLDHQSKSKSDFKNRFCHGWCLWRCWCCENTHRIVVTEMVRLYWKYVWFYMNKYDILCMGRNCSILMHCTVCLYLWRIYFWTIFVPCQQAGESSNIDATHFKWN